MSSYVTLFVGMLFANVLLLFGMMMVPLLNHYQNEVTQSQIADYQYILKTTTDVNYATDRFAREFERPAVYNQATRQSYSNNFYNTYFANK